MADYTLAVDIGASKIMAAIIAPDGDIVIEKRIATPHGGVEEGIEHVIELVLEGAGLKRVDTAGVAAPGPIDYSLGAIVDSPNMNQDIIRVADVVKRYSRNLILANDGVAGIWAEKALVNPSLENAVLVTIGTGIGGGVLVDGRLLIGSRGNAHEIGHIVLNVDSPLKCGCGGIGHWEALAGGRWVPRTARFLSNRVTIDSNLYRKARSSSVTVEEIYNCARRGDKFAEFIIDYLNMIHAAGIASIASTYDPDLILIAGGLFARHHDIILEGVRKYLEKFLGEYSRPRIVEASFGEYQSLYGAYSIAYRPPGELVELNRKWFNRI